MIWPILNAAAGLIAAGIIAYKLVVLPWKFTPIELTGMGLLGGGMVLTVGPILSTIPTPFEDWSGFLIRLGVAVYFTGRATRHRYNNWVAVRHARQHMRDRA